MHSVIWFSHLLLIEKKMLVRVNLNQFDIYFIDSFITNHRNEIKKFSSNHLHYPLVHLKSFTHQNIVSKLWVFFFNDIDEKKSLSY